MSAIWQMIFPLGSLIPVLWSSTLLPTGRQEEREQSEKQFAQSLEAKKAPLDAENQARELGTTIEASLKAEVLP